MVLCTSNETHAYTMSDGKCGMSESTKMFIIRTSRNQNVVMMSLELICYVYKENEKKNLDRVKSKNNTRGCRQTPLNCLTELSRFFFSFKYSNTFPTHKLAYFFTLVGSHLRAVTSCVLFASLVRIVGEYRRSDLAGSCSNLHGVDLTRGMVRVSRHACVK